MAINLAKKEEALKLTLSKKKIVSVRMQVATVLDRSGSMDHYYRNGTVQEYMERLVPIGLKFDDNGEIDNWAFHTSAYKTGPVNVNNLENFVQREIERISSGGTAYAPALKAVNEHYFGTAASVRRIPHENRVEKEPTGFFGKLFGKKTVEIETTYTEEPVSGTPGAGGQDPVYVIFQTDGATGDTNETDRVLGELAKKNVYVQFVGVGDPSDFSFIEKMGEKYDHVGFIHIEDLKKTTDEEIYDLLISEELKNFLLKRFPSNITVA